MNKMSRFSIWYILLFLLLIFAIQNYFDVRRYQNVSYSDFRKLVDLKGVKKLTITSDTITGRLTADGVDYLIKDDKHPELKELMKQEDNKTEPHFMTVRLEDPDLIKNLDKEGISYTARMSNTWLTTLVSWLLPMALLAGVWIYFIRKLGTGAGGGLMSIGKSKAKFYVETETKVTFKDVAGVDEAIEELQEVIDFLQNPSKFQSLGGKIPKGVLLVGPPGTGKTLLGRAVAGEAGVPFLSLTGSDFVEMFVGVGAARVRDLFAQAEEKAPCIIFIDELDAIGKARSASPITGGHEERENTLNQLLSEMDGFDTRKGVIIMSATNRPEILDPALIRPGRFDRQIMVDRPSLIGREDILKVHARGVKLADNVDLHKIAARTPGMVGSDLANIINEAALLAARKNKGSVEMVDFEEAIDRVMAGLEKRTKVMNPKEKEIVAYHETGHALVAESVPTADPVHRVSIIPRGIGSLGYTLQLPTEDRYLMTREELDDRLAVLLGGRVAEEIIFKQASTGAQNDLFRATDIARSMIREYGMSQVLGPVTFERERRPLFLDTMMPPSTKDYSEATAQEIDREVSSLISHAHDRATEILHGKKAVLEQVAQMLLKKEVLEGDELRQVLNGKDHQS